MGRALCSAVDGDLPNYTAAEKEWEEEGETVVKQSKQSLFRRASRPTKAHHIHNVAHSAQRRKETREKKGNEGKR